MFLICVHNVVSAEDVHEVQVRATLHVVHCQSHYYFPGISACNPHSQTHNQTVTTAHTWLTALPRKAHVLGCC